ncbi:MAG TPA: hypothetical protein VFQ51_10155, partial [Vicinamibacteria bacterium]|nr:hypothetical protein [Vicinamibacteria bacterium]
MSTALDPPPDGLAAARAAAGPTCPICHAYGTVAEPAIGLPAEVVALVAANTPGWQPEMGLCRECAERFAMALRTLAAHEDTFEAGAILPTPVRLGAPDRYRGRGVTIAFLDSGFYAHPDLVQPRNRIRKYVDITKPGARADVLQRPDAS